MITLSEMSQCIPAAEDNYALKIQRKHLTFFPDSYCVGLLYFIFLYYYLY